MPSLIVGTAGHIDHGKSTLVEALTGTHPDRLKEEKARGITIDLGFAHAVVGDSTVSFVDVPGHERFVRNMLAGAGGFDAVMLVVAADESVMPQTREHFHVCRLLGIERGLVALTKIDRVDADTAELAALEVRELVAGSFLEGVAIVPVSARTGAGLDRLRAELLALAHAGTRQCRADVVRLPVDRVFTMKGFGTVITGTLVSGRIREGDELVGLPDTGPIRVRGLQVHGSHEAEAAAPTRVALNIGSTDVNEIARGVTLATAGGLSVTRRVDVRIHALTGGRPLRHGARLRAHQGTSDTTARLALCAVRDSGDQPWRRLQPGEAEAAIPPGGDGFGRLRLERAMALTRSDRLVLRAITPAATLGGAVVLDPEPPAIALRRATSLERFRALDNCASQNAGLAAIRIWLAESGAAGSTLADAIRRGGLSADAARAAMHELAAQGDAISGEGRWFHAGTARALEQTVTEALRRFHADHPNDAGMSRDALRERTAPRGGLFDVILQRLAAAGTLRHAERVALSSHSLQVSDEDIQLRQRIEEIVRQSGLGPLDTASVRRESGAAPPVFDRHVRDLISGRKLVRLDTFLFHADVLARLRSEVQGLRQNAPPPAETWLDVATFKSRYGLSRKYAIPLLEWLDRERVTRRVGERRLVLA